MNQDENMGREVRSSEVETNPELYSYSLDKLRTLRGAVVGGEVQPEVLRVVGATAFGDMKANNSAREIAKITGDISVHQSVLMFRRKDY